MKKHILKLVNDERTNVRIASKKGYTGPCTAGAYDWCPSASTDYAFCSGAGAYDDCKVKDYYPCMQGQLDACSIDVSMCLDPSANDITL